MGLSGYPLIAKRRPESEILCCSRRCSVPLRHGGGSEGSHRVSGDQVALEIERIIDCTVGGNEALSLTLGLEPLHLSFPSSDGKVTVLSPIVLLQSTWFVAG